MVFSSFQFVLVFLPVVVAVFVLLQRQGRTVASSYWLIGASLFFYGWWNYLYLFLPLGSVICNYWLGRRLADSATPNRRLLIFGIAANLALLGYYKYAGFFAENLVTWFGVPIAIPKIALPLAISFCTFQQVSFLVDCSRKQVRNLNFRRYLLYIVFFPHLIAGPIVRHHELLPQLEEPRPMPTRWTDLTWGLHLFVLGLLKKTLIADLLAGYADPVFGAAATGTAPSLLEAWGAAFAYTFQLYFDFSGYADMAVGSARMFGIILPENFNSPYQAANIADFWRRWHITLSHFLRDYLYIPLGGNRVGEVRTYLNLVITMLLGGLWHGAAWTFVIWGAAHGMALAVNHWWRDFSRSRGWTMPKPVAYGITMLFVIFGWVIFRAENWGAAQRMLEGMCGQTQLLLPRELAFVTGWGGSLGELAITTTRNLGNLPDAQVFLYVLVLLIMCKVAPNSRQWVEERGFGAPENLTFARCALLAALLALCMVNLLAHNEVFIYYVF
jgi:D-alanyl-lipoteichoic acid acyltransferase DltB (MBOAT superfamily)